MTTLYRRPPPDLDAHVKKYVEENGSATCRDVSKAFNLGTRKAARRLSILYRRGSIGRGPVNGHEKTYVYHALEAAS